MNDDVVRVELTDSAPRLIVDAGARGGGQVSGVLRRADREPAHARGVRAGRAVPGVVRGAGPGAHGGRAAARGGLHPTHPGSAPTVKQHLAALRMRRQDYFRQERQGWLRLHEKGGPRHDVPAHHRAAEALDDYLARAGRSRGVSSWR